MAVHVETLDKLERRITLSLPAQAIASDIDARLRKLARTVKADGFRPGKVPMSFVAQRYGATVQAEVLNDRISQEFSKAIGDAKLRVAGQPRITEKTGAPEGEVAFDATFEVFPEVTIGDLSATEIERVSSDVTEEAVDKTIDILRRQRRTFRQKPATAAVEAGDRVTIDFRGTIDGTAFEGGTASDFAFVVGEGQMLEQFDQAVRGMKAGDSKTFPLQFPADYHGQDVAGKEADFMVTVKKIEAADLPEVDAAFASSLGIAGGTVESLRADVRKNLDREVKMRVNARNRAAVMGALAGAATLDIPKALVEQEAERMIGDARQDLKNRGLKDAESAPLPTELFREPAERRVQRGLGVGELVRRNDLQAKPEQLQAHIEELAQSYEKPADVMRWYLSDRQRMAEVEATVVENNVAKHVLDQAKVTEKKVPFDELMANQPN
jgi:trigger factor